MTLSEVAQHHLSHLPLLQAPDTCFLLWIHIDVVMSERIMANELDIDRATKPPTEYGICFKEQMRPNARAFVYQHFNSKIKPVSYGKCPILDKQSRFKTNVWQLDRLKRHRSLHLYQSGPTLTAPPNSTRFTRDQIAPT